MPSTKIASRLRAGARLAPALATAALTLAACGAVRVQPKTPAGSIKLSSRGQVDSPLTNVDNHLACLRAANLPVQVVSPIRLQIGAPASGPTVVFTATPGAAQAAQIDNLAPGAEVIGSALIYPNQGSDAELTGIESCLAQGVQG